MRSRLFYETMMNVMRRNVAKMREEYEYLCEHLDSMSEEEAYESMLDMMEKTRTIENRLEFYEQEINRQSTFDSTGALRG